MKTLEKTIRIEAQLPKPVKIQSRYTTLDTLGEGGLGVVCRGHDTKLDREVAIKRLHPIQAGSAVSPDALRREALILAAVNHPNIVSIYDVYEEEGEVCIVMELLEGTTLERVLDSSKFSINDFTELVQQTQDALLAAHSKGIVHGDIKPQNIIKVEKDYGRDQYKLLDFDQAQLIGSVIPQASNHSTCGSIYFMAPERFEGTPPTHASDTYAMGSVYYFALTGQFPCSGKTTVEIMAAHMRNDITPLKELRPDLPQWLCQWVQWLLAPSPAGRPKSPHAVKESYNELLERFSSLPKKFIDAGGTANRKESKKSDRWYVTRGDQVGGPHTWETIQGFLNTDALKTTDLIKNDSMTEWAKINNLLEKKMQNAG